TNLRSSPATACVFFAERARKTRIFFERFEGDPVYLHVVSTVHGDGDVCSSYGLLGVRSLEPPRKGRLLFLGDDVARDGDGTALEYGLLERAGRRPALRRRR